MKVSRYWKLVVAAVAAGAVAANVALADMAITGNEGVTIALAVLGALGVWRVPNRQEPPNEVPHEARTSQ